MPYGSAATPKWPLLIAFAIGAWFIVSIIGGPLLGQLLRARGRASAGNVLRAVRRPPAASGP